jgi:hypothetical protein
LRVYRDRREEARRKGHDGRQGTEAGTEEGTSAGMKVVKLDRAPSLHIGATRRFDESRIRDAKTVDPDTYNTIDMRRFAEAQSVGPDGRTSFGEWEEKVKEEERAAAARGKLLEVKGAVVERRFEDFASRCDDCDTTSVCKRCHGRGKVYLIFKCKFCAGTGRCLQCLPISERPCPVCGEDLSLQSSRCYKCGREFLCPVCRRHLPFAATRCPTCDVRFRCASCQDPVAITHQKSCDRCGGKNLADPNIIRRSG